jgi:Rrf2 family protein
MFTIGRHTDYAARIVLHLSGLESGVRVTAREIAAKRLIPPAFIRRIVSRLSAAGILTTTRGSGGGIALAREASQISLRDVVEAFEGPLSLNGCVAEPGDCPLAVDCPVQGAWVKATRHLSNDLSEVKFGDLVMGIEGVPSPDGSTPTA